jgi:hypothetical protein
MENTNNNIHLRCDICEYDTNDKSNLRRHHRSNRHVKNELTYHRGVMLSIASGLRDVSELTNMQVERYIHWCMTKCAEVGLNFNQYFDFDHYSLNRPDLLHDMLTVLYDYHFDQFFI